MLTSKMGEDNLQKDATKLYIMKFMKGAFIEHDYHMTISISTCLTKKFNRKNVLDFVMDVAMM